MMVIRHILLFRSVPTVAYNPVFFLQASLKSSKRRKKTSLKSKASKKGTEVKPFSFTIHILVKYNAVLCAGIALLSFLIPVLGQQMETLYSQTDSLSAHEAITCVCES